MLYQKKWGYQHYLKNQITFLSLITFGPCHLEGRLQKTAIHNRGWFPCNLRLLTNVEILSTKMIITTPDTNVPVHTIPTVTSPTPTHTIINVLPPATTIDPINLVVNILPPTKMLVITPLPPNFTKPLPASPIDRTNLMVTLLSPIELLVITSPPLSVTKPSPNTPIDFESEHIPSTNKKSTTATRFISKNSTITTDVVPSPWINLRNLNFDKVLADNVTIDILQHVVRKEKVHENFIVRYVEG